MKTLNPKNISVPELHGYLLGAVAPRPIAFASTVDQEGNVNLSPFSFFNCFSSNPPILIFSPARRVRDNTTKHTLENALAVDEVVINIVNYAIVEQMSLSSTEYDRGVDEFTKSGLTPISSQMVKPPRVDESPAAFECKVKQVIPLGDQGGAGNLIVCEVVLAHFKEEILDENGKIDPFEIDVVGRMGGNWYTRAHGGAIFEIAKPVKNKGIGVDQIPESIQQSEVLTGNNLGRLGNVETLPAATEVEAFARSTPEIKALTKQFTDDTQVLRRHLHTLARGYLEKGAVEDAWKVLLQNY